MHVAAKEIFLEAVRRLQLSQNSSAVVGLSGGPDSVALTFLARQYFSKVVAVTVDHRLREESGEEAEHAGKLARSLGVDHVITPLEWSSAVGRTGSRARALRYTALMKECERLNADMLLVGHHYNDQIETLLIRLMMGSGIVGLAGMQHISYWATNQNRPIIRPLLNTTKSSLVQLCQEEGLEWIEDPTNSLPVSPRNRIRHILARHPQLTTDLGEILSMCQDTRDDTHKLINDAVKRLTNVNYKYGVVTFDGERYRSLNPFIARGVLTLWLRYINGKGGSTNRYGVGKLHDIVTLNKTTADTHNRCILIPQLKRQHFMIAKQSPMSGQVRSTRVPIRVGQTIIWDDRFRISLFDKRVDREEEKDGENLETRIFYVRNFVRTDNEYLNRGVRKVKGSVLLHRQARGSLPVIIDEAGRVVLIPHFRVIDHRVGVNCKVTFEPQWTIDNLLNFHFISSESTNAT